MASSIRQADDVDAFCPDCLTSLSGDPSDCPECGAESAGRGWPPLRASSHPYLGKIVDDRYLLDRYIGGGASGSVYRAEDVKLNRPFALKILDLSGEDGSSSESSLRRFENEVEALTRIRNPHVINIYESYRLEGETPAMLTEFIEGVTLSEMLGGGEALDVESASTLIRQVANGLHEAHGRGVIHRDLKPANVMVEKLPAAGSFARILDFGLVHLSDSAGETRGFWGTPLYAAPEQCAPGPPITAATDIYSLGCVVFHCIAGEPPFVQNDARAIMRAHVEEAAPSLSERADQAVPERVDEIVGAMLEKGRQDRPDDLAEVLEAFSAVQSDSGAWERAVGIQESSELDLEETSEALELEARHETADGTRIGVGETGAERPRIAQLLHSVDLKGRFPEISEPIETAELDRGGDCAVVSDAEGQIYVMSAKGDSYYQAIPPIDAQVSAIAPDIGRGRVFAVEPGGRVYKWRLHGGDQSASVEAVFDEKLYSLALGSQGQRLYAGTEEGRVVRRDLRVEKATEICAVADTASTLHVPRKGDWLLAATENGGPYAVQDRRDASNVLRLDSVDRPILSLALDRESGVAVAVDGESRLRLFHIGGSFGGVVVSPDVDNLRTVTIAPDHQIFAMGVSRLEARVWRIRQERIGERLPHIDQESKAPAGRARAFGGRSEG